MSGKPEVKIVEGEKTLELPVWWNTGGGMMIRRECLAADHPEHPYNYLKSHGFTPEDWGIYHGDTAAREQFRDWSKEKLISEVLELRKQLEACYAAGF